MFGEKWATRRFVIFFFFHRLFPRVRCETTSHHNSITFFLFLPFDPSQTLAASRMQRAAVLAAHQDQDDIQSVLTKILNFDENGCIFGFPLSPALPLLIPHTHKTRHSLPSICFLTLAHSLSPRFKELELPASGMRLFNTM